MNMRHMNQKALHVTTQRSQCWHLQRVACNKTFECLTTDWDSALDLKIVPKAKDTDKKNRKTHFQEKTKNSLITLRLVKLQNDSLRS
jgi:hypothetical protein